MDSCSVYQKYVSTHFAGEGRCEERFFRLQRRVFRKNYLPLLPSRRSARIVDLGCGLGHFLAFLVQEGYRNILGVDASPECVKFCRRRGLPVKQAEIAEFLATAQNRFDVVVLNDVLEHQTKRRLYKLLRLAYESLTPGGILLARVPNMANPFLATDSRYLDITHELGFNESSLRQILLMTGFAKVEVYEVDIYVLGGVLSWLAKGVVKILNGMIRLIFLLYGRGKRKILSKSILALAVKEPRK
jgi:2-polyprenyl-3-methyl-5-hydroxy-6-metoxy-1,4-benzoquinol methylase